MEIRRKPFQGVLNIIRFNWHFYLIAGITFIILIFLKSVFPPSLQSLILIGASLALFTILISLLVSFYIYDLSDLYQLKWLNHLDNTKILNISAGFDETSEMIQNKFRDVDLTVCDFYNPIKHKEISIKRARQLYRPQPGTITVSTERLPFAEHTFDKSLAILSAHEIRNEAERIRFFKELERITKSSGQICVTEHLRDFNNFLAYSIGFLHFHSRESWLRTFDEANLALKQEIKTTPFITTFILERNGDKL